VRIATATYLRVSTTDQSHDPQRDELRDYCARREWKEVVEYSDTISGAKFTRCGLDRLMADVRRGRIERVVVVKLDRLGRSLPHLAQLIGELDAHRVALIAASQGIDTSHDNPAGRLQMHVLMAVAEFERSLIRERTKAGLNAARARGAKLGRRAIVLDAMKREALAAWKAAPTTLRDLAGRLGVSVGKASALVHAHDL
jgi:DNA invertase Pin-like site-specific DNA recombinase